MINSHQKMADVQLHDEERSSWFSPRSWFRWKPTSMSALARAEYKILSHVWHLLDEKFVTVCNGTKKIRTIVMNSNSSNTPLVLVHGMGSGVGLWALNLQKFSENRPVYAFDVLGFGRSSRPQFSKDAMLAEMEFVESIEEWRKEMKLERFVMLGHSLGGFVSAAYAIRYPQHLQHLILVDPWGFPERIPESERATPVPTWIKVVATVLQTFNPLSGIRAAGPWGPSLVNRLRPDLPKKFNDLFDDDTVVQYIYHCNAQEPSGEIAFKNLTAPMGWAKYPMVKRIAEVPADLPITMMYGSRSWIDSGVGFQVKYLRSDSPVDVQIVKGAGHHVYADAAKVFNEIVNTTCETADQNPRPLVRPPPVIQQESTV